MAQQILCDGCLSKVDMGLPRCPYCGHAFVNRNPAGALEANTLLAGRYTIGDCIAIDGEGVTYKAIDGETSQRVVIKEYVPVTICAARGADGSVIPRPEREVLFKTTRMDFIDLYRTLLRMGRTEGLVPVLDLIEANNTAYAVREPDEGETLLTYLEQRELPLTPEEALLLLRSVVYGVEAMHRMGLLHRGISPETVFITPSGARLSGYATQGLRTVGGDLKSQLFDGYSAPEQYSVAEFDGKYTDVYALGALFYRAMTGHTPVSANLRRMNDTLPAAHTVEKEIPGYVSTALGQAMRLAPDERMQSVTELQAALTAPVKAEAGFHLTQRQIKFLALAAAGLVLVAALSIWAIFSSSKKSAASDTSSSEESSSASDESASSVASVSVPLLVGKQYKTVTENSEYMQNFLFAAEYEYSADYKEGEIIRQDPSAGVIVEPGTLITLTVSKGVKTEPVPNVVGLSDGDAKAALSAVGLQYVIVHYPNTDGAYTANCVVETNPAAGTVVEVDSTVVVLSVATEPPAASSSTSTETSSSQTTSASSSTSQTTPASSSSSETTAPASSSTPATDSTSATDGSSAAEPAA